MTVCKHCFTRVAYSNGNTSNMTAHLRRHHPAITHTYPTSSERHIKITKAVGVFIAKDLQPFSVIGDAGFCHLIKTIDPRYRLPSRTFFSTEIIPDLYEKTCNSIVNELAKAQSLALTTDGWTSRATMSYLTISCFAHVVNLAAKKAVSINTVSRLLARVRKIVTFFHKSTKAHHVLTVKQEMLNLPRHKLIHDVTTRWNTVHDMLERYTEQQPAIYSALLDKSFKLSVKNVTMLNDSEQKLAEELIQVLTPLKTVTALMSSETTPTISMILPLKEMILKSMSPGDQDSGTVKEAKAAIINDLAKRYTDPNLHDCLQIATALDPRFKSLPYLEDSRDKLYRNIIHEILEHEQQGLVENPVPSTDEHNPSYPPPKKKTAMSEVFGELFKTEEKQGKPFPQIIEEEVTTYKLADSIHVDECKFPHVAKAAQQHLCVPGTSVASERICSTAGDIVSAKHSRLAAENVDRLIFLQKNLKIQE
ncbi:zinc finger BED domain-containing protein 4-like [Carassius auratus]|uniref:Zinc finger BED domain-containing protein 4-like n=1 Tax=Carassius auratus TaxID=7957 RepID=A0A6P6NVS3_CARAU|nr:zinc finger BED domain-containing protein 4-like [Carassius auratus]